MRQAGPCCVRAGAASGAMGAPCAHAGGGPWAAAGTGTALPRGPGHSGAAFPAAGCHPRASGPAACGTDRMAAEKAGRHDGLRRRRAWPEAGRGHPFLSVSPFVRISWKGCGNHGYGRQEPRRTEKDRRPCCEPPVFFLYLWAGQTVIMPDSSPVWRGVVRAVSAGDEDALQASTAPQRAPFRVQKAASTSRASCPRARTRNSGGLRRPGPSRAPSRPARRRSPRKRAAPWPVRARAWAGWRTAGAS